MREIARAAEHMEIGFIDFEDENISLNREWFLSLLKAIRRFFGARPPELRAMNGLFPASLDEKVIARMQQAGFKTLNLSLGSANPAQQRRFKRPDLRIAFDRALASARRHRIAAVGYLIAGGPGQKALTVVDDLLFLAARRVLAGLSIFYPAPGSSDFAWCRDNDHLPDDIARWRSTALPLGGTKDRLASATLLRLTRILNYMKLCLDETGTIPAPAPLNTTALAAATDRDTRGRLLLQGFLYDGKIRGIDRQGKVYTHQAAIHLVEAFRTGLRHARLEGARRV
jgi:hypothetical protein